MLYRNAHYAGYTPKAEISSCNFPPSPRRTNIENIFYVIEKDARYMFTTYHIYDIKINDKNINYQNIIIILFYIVELIEFQRKNGEKPILK